MSRWLVLLGLGLTTAAAWGQGVAPVGPEILVAADGPTSHLHPAIPHAAVDGRGDFVVAWESQDPTDGFRYSIWAARFAAGGDLRGAPLRVAGPTPEDIIQPQVAAGPDGSFWVVWRRSSVSIQARRVAPDGALSPVVDLVSLPPARFIFDPPSIAADAVGNFVVAWTITDPDFVRSVHVRTVSHDGTAGEEILVRPGGPPGESFVHSPAVAVSSGGELLVTWSEGFLSSEIHARRYAADGSPRGEAFGVGEISGLESAHHGAALRDDGAFLIVWQRPAGSHPNPFGFVPFTRLGARAFRADGTPAGEVFDPVPPIDDPNVFHVHPRVVPLAGGFLVGWVHALLVDVSPTLDDRIEARRISKDGIAQGEPVRIDPVRRRNAGGLTLAAGPDGTVVAVWKDRADLSTLDAEIRARRLESQPSCTPGDTQLCLMDRFAVAAAFATALPSEGLGHAVPLTEDSGTFWFFEPANVELVVKVLDACRFSGHFWVFAAGLTNVEVELTVADTVTGAVERYSNPLGIPFQPIQDTTAFATCP